MDIDYSKYDQTCFSRNKWNKRIPWTCTMTYIVHTPYRQKHFIWISFYFCHIILHKSNFFACERRSHVMMKLYMSPTIPKVSSKDTIIYSVCMCGHDPLSGLDNPWQEHWTIYAYSFRSDKIRAHTRDRVMRSRTMEYAYLYAKASSLHVMTKYELDVVLEKSVER